jgi:SAM-dependent methyltransferase
MNIFALTIFAGAFLLFQVQPLIAKFILPWFGGGPGVWTTCMLFFQTFLLAGYAYAHGLSRFVSQRRQPAIHLALLVVALLLLPITPATHWKPGPLDNPTWRIFLLLIVSLSLPYLALAATGPLLQAWFSKLHPGKSPYRLYALSNTGSLLALVSYPLFIEPALSRHAQAKVWSWSFAVFVVLCAACAAKVLKGSPKKPDRLQKLSHEKAPQDTLNWMWFVLPACGSILLLATTNKLCQDIASVPFLWVLPLVVYLLTFILCFDRPESYPRKTCIMALLPVLGIFCYALFKEEVLSIWLQVIIYTATLLLCCMICHGEVYRLRPAPAFLTGFYLMIAAGGAAGGVLVAVVAPLIFRSYAELNWGIWLVCALVLVLVIKEKKKGANARWPMPILPVLTVNLVVIGGLLLWLSAKQKNNVVDASRNFYGVLRVREVFDPVHAFKEVHGDVNHGLQVLDPAMRNRPTTYYTEDSGIGVVMRSFPRQQNRRIGIVGLGIGTLAAYGRAGDVISFYEIDPQVEQFARKQFKFLEQCAGEVDVVMGDARLSLESQPSQQFDILVLDAFSSDAIPTHLLTREVFEIYFRHLKPDGVIAVHVSNRHLDLFPVIMGIAQQFHTLMADVIAQAHSIVDLDSNWIIISRNEKFMMSPEILENLVDMSKIGPGDSILWTDDNVSLLKILVR